MKYSQVLDLRSSALWLANPINLKNPHYVEICANTIKDIRSFMQEACDFEARPLEILMAEVQSIMFEIEEGTGEVLLDYYLKIHDMFPSIEFILNEENDLNKRAEKSRAFVADFEEEQNIY